MGSSPCPLRSSWRGWSFAVGNRCIPKGAAARALPLHAYVGKQLVAGALITCALGSLAAVWKNGDAEPRPFAPGVADWKLQNWSGLFMLLELGRNAAAQHAAAAAVRRPVGRSSGRGGGGRVVEYTYHT